MKGFRPFGSDEGLGSKERATPQAEVRGERLADTMARVFDLWNRSRAELELARRYLAACIVTPAHAADWARTKSEIREFLEATASVSEPAAHFTESPGTPDPPTYPESDEGLAYQAINRLARFRIGVHDYESCVACLRSNYKLIFGDYVPLTDPQDMIQRLAAEIQNLRRDAQQDKAEILRLRRLKFPEAQREEKENA